MAGGAKNRGVPTADELERALGNNTAAGEATPPASAPEPKRPKAQGMPDTVRIILEENDNIPPIGQYFGINGRGYLLKPGIPVNVPVGIIDILENAVEDRPIVDQQTKQILEYRKRLRFPYRRVAEAA